MQRTIQTNWSELFSIEVEQPSTPEPFDFDANRPAPSEKYDMSNEPDDLLF